MMNMWSFSVIPRYRCWSHAGLSCNKMYWSLMTKKTQFSRDLWFAYNKEYRQDCRYCCTFASVCRSHAGANSARYHETGRRRFILPETNLGTIYLVARFADAASAQLNHTVSNIDGFQGTTVYYDKPFSYLIHIFRYLKLIADICNPFPGICKS